MHVFSYKLLALAAAVAPAAAYVPESTLATDAIAAAGLAKLTLTSIDGSLKKQLATKGVLSTCNIKDVAVRREYSTLSNREKLAYTNAVKCLMNSPSQMAEGEAPGAKSRYDDFVAIHITQTPFIHLSGSFLSWHRNYIYAFERALRDECDYDGYLPYWNWGKSAKDPINSPYMDGSPYSQGGNGVWRPHNCTRPGNINAPCISPVVEGRGGGCVETGPYVGYQANLSSVDTWFDYPNVVAGPLLSYQPRCIQRDILPEYTAKWQTDDHLLALYTNSSLNTIGPWQAALQSGTGLHSVGHFSYGGNPGGDVYTSPNDPMFWLHHGMIDRSWWVWQNQDPITRSFQIAGTRTMNNSPPSEDATLEDIIDLGAVTPKCMSKLGIKHHVSSVAGPYCYIYL